MLAEIANIVIGSYLTELGDTWGVELDPTPAELDVSMHDVLGAVDLISVEHEVDRVIALGCGFADDAGSYDVSVWLLLQEQGAERVARQGKD